jgi:hypothetical protein
LSLSQSSSAPSSSVQPQNKEARKLHDELNAEEKRTIKNVWLHNFEEELRKISELIDQYPYLAMVRSFIQSFIF